MMYNALHDNLLRVQHRINNACKKAGRDRTEVCLLAVSKTFSSKHIETLYQAGQRAFGENYVQEGVGKIKDLSHYPIEWHYIGPLQSNKTRMVATHFTWVHTIDRIKIAERLSQQRPQNLSPLQVCIQANIDGSQSKAGVKLSELPTLAKAIAKLPRLVLRGIMTIPDVQSDRLQTLAIHQKARTCFDDLCQQGFTLDTLSMGMSADLEEAIAMGSTMVRIGTALFGQRHPNNKIR